MPRGSEIGDAPAKFLRDLGTLLGAQKDVDAGLAKILSDHVLQESQKPQSVAEAARAIALLAADRAKAARA